MSECPPQILDLRSEILDPRSEILDPEGSPEGSAPAAPAPAGEPAPSKPKRPKRASWRFVPSDWEPKKRHRDKAFSMGWTPEEFQVEVEKFQAHEFKAPKSDPDRAFDAWLLSPIAKEGKSSHGAARGHSGHRSRNSEALDYAFAIATGKGRE